MSIDLLHVLNSALGDPAVRQVSGLLGETSFNTESAIRTAGPVLLAALLQQGASRQGAGEIFRAVTSDAIDEGLPGKLGEAFANHNTLESLVGSGEPLTGMLFGSRNGAVMNALSQVSDVRPNSAMAILSMVAPLLFGALKKYVLHNDMDASSLASIIQRQRGSLARSGLDDRMAGALGFSNMGALLASLPGPAARSRPAAAAASQENDRSWLPWGIAAGVALVGVMFFVNRTSEHQSAPSGAVQVAEVPSEHLRVASADSAQVYFETGDASIDQDDRERIAVVAHSARTSDRPVAITGYTDSTGDAATNDELARNRALAVREALVREGIEEERILMDPPRSVTGTGTDEEARRVDIDMR